jgi:hypothetical protein
MDVRKQDQMPVRQEFYDHKNRLKKAMTYSEIKNMGGRIIPTRMQMDTVENDTIMSTTTLIYEKLIFDRVISESIFSKSNLRK